MMYFRTPSHPPLLHITSGRFVTQTPFLHPIRTMNSFVIFLGLEGELYIASEGQEYVLSPGTMLLLPADRVHRGTRLSTPQLSYYWCHFVCRDQDHTLIDGEAMMAGGPYDADRNGEIVLPAFARLTTLDRPTMLFGQLLHVASARYRSQYAADYALSSLMIELTEQTWAQRGSAMPQGSRTLLRAMEWIRSNLDRPLSVQTVAAQFAYHPDYLSSLFRKETGMSMLHYIQNLRIARARELLLHTGMTVQEIAHTVGYTDEKYFSRLFKSMAQVTPTQFRNAYNQAAEDTLPAERPLKIAR